MEKLNVEVYNMFKNEYVTIMIYDSIRYLVLDELSKYIEVLDMEYEMTRENIVLEDISDSKTLFLRLTLNMLNENYGVEMTISEFLILENLLHCSISACELFDKQNNSKMSDLKKLCKSMEEVRKMLGKRNIDEYRKFLRHYKANKFMPKAVLC